MIEFPYYTGTRREPVHDGHAELPRSRRAWETRPDRYIPDEGLRDAVNVALLLNQPLLLTGEPGSGKTQLAYSVAWELGFGEPLKFETKSTSSARDLFYVYDALGRYHEERKTTQAVDYITFSALGIAILRTRERSLSEKYLPAEHLPESPMRSLVLIDEIDKAPRDFPNDVLGELEGMYFRIPELDNIRIEADRDSPPVLIITSNSEKHLPDAFLRRCTYYHIPFPDKDRMKQIVSGRLSGEVDLDEPFLGDALDLFYELRENRSQIRKKPSTAELLGWLVTLRRLEPEARNPIRDLDTERVVSTIATLVKNGEDAESASIAIRRWLKRTDDDSGPNADG